MSYSVIILAAGQGKRMNAGMNKQFIELEGMPVIIHTLRVFERDVLCQNIVLVVNDQEREQFAHLLHRFEIKKVTSLVPGGEERQQSVYNGLKAVGDTGIILIHDGARPFVTIQKIHELVQVTGKTGAAVLAVPVKDTMKQVVDGQIEKTVDRSSLWAVQTPQAFSVPLIRHAHEQAKEEQFIGTDDASLVERIGHRVAIVEGEYTNIKLTTKEDLLFAEAILRARGDQ